LDAAASKENVLVRCFGSRFFSCFLAVFSFIVYIGKNAMISVYTSAFNVTKMAFDWQAALENFLAIGDEVVVAVNTSEDDTQDSFVKWVEERAEMPVKLVFTAFSYDDPDLDGKIKNAALQETTYPYKLGLDLDEKINPKFKEQLKNLTSYFFYDKTDCIMLPVINLYKNRDHFKNISQKFYFHRAGLKRGTVNFAKRKYDNTHDITKSDSCELLESNGELPRCMYLIPPQASDYQKLQVIKQNNLPFVVHEGLLDLEKKAKKNELFWKKMWEIENGSPVDIPTTAAGIEEKEKLVEGHVHGLEVLNT
jgi:hypothetical protein